MENPASQAHPELRPEVLDLLEDHPRGLRPSRARQVALMEEALTELDRFGPLLEVRLGQVLAPMLRGGHKHLGYVTPAVFCREELGISATAAWDSVRLAEGLLRRPILRQAFLEEGLPRTHVLELLRLDEAGDAEWAARAANLPVQELRRVTRPLRPSRAGEEKEAARFRTYDLEAEPYATWLAAVELARRREGRDLGPADALEQILAEFAAARPLQVPSGDGQATTLDGCAGTAHSASLLLPKEGRQESACAPSAPAPFQRDPRWLAPASTSPIDQGDTEAGSGCATPATGPPPELPGLLRQELPRSPRKLTRLARKLLASRERLELQRGRILRRVQEGRLYREAGQRSLRAWLENRGIAASTAFQVTARDQRLEKHGLLRQALSEGRLSPTQVDLLLRLPRRADAENWVAYAEEHTCRRLEEAVEAARVLATRFPSTWTHRRGAAPGEDETLEDFRRQAGLQGFESTCEDLARAFEQAESSRTAPEGVQTSAAPPPAPTPTSNPSAGATADPPPALRLRLVLPESLDRLLQAAEARLRQDAGQALTSEECLYILCLVFLRQAGQEDSGQGRVRRQALERAGWRCEVPGCACRTNLHVHHIQRRSQGGSDELENLAVACSSHHLRHLHGGTMRVEGEEPATRIWEIGLEEGEPWRVYCDERLVDGEALAWEGGADRACETTPEYRCGPATSGSETRAA